MKRISLFGALIGMGGVCRHSGVGTADYCFVWSMGGENLEFDDMDVLTLAELS